MSEAMVRFIASLVGLGTVLVVGVALVFALAGSAATTPSGYSHDRLEADRIMTQRMAVDIGSGMQTQMPSFGMLQRSSDPAYVKALEQHIYQLNRSIGQEP